MRDYVFPMFRANAAYEGLYLLGTSIARPLIAKKQIEIAEKVGADAVVPRRDRQGQRPGPLRARLLCAEARRHGHRALARMGPALPRAAHRLRRAAPDPDRQGQARRGAVLGRRQPPARLLRGQGAGGPGAGGARLRLSRAPSIPRSAPDKPTVITIDFEKGDPVAIDGRKLSPGDAADEAQRARPRQRHRPPRPRREPLRRHEVPRHVRDARRHDPARSRIAASSRSRSTAARRISRTS